MQAGNDLIMPGPPDHIETWIADAGEYMLKVGVSSRDIRQTARFSLPAEVVVEKPHKVLQPDNYLRELRAAR